MAFDRRSKWLNVLFVLEINFSVNPPAMHTLFTDYTWILRRFIRAQIQNPFFPYFFSSINNNYYNCMKSIHAFTDNIHDKLLFTENIIIIITEFISENSFQCQCQQYVIWIELFVLECLGECIADVQLNLTRKSSNNANPRTKNFHERKMNVKFNVKNE